MTTSTDIDNNSSDNAPEFELNKYGWTKREPCVQPKFTLDEYVAECGPCGPDTVHGALWRELAYAATKPEVAAAFSTTLSQEALANGEPSLMRSIFDKPRLFQERSNADSSILGKRMAVMLVIPEKRDAAVADVRRLIAGEDLTEAADWAFREVTTFVLSVFGHYGWWNAPTARHLSLYRTASIHILNEVKSLLKGSSSPKTGYAVTVYGTNYPFSGTVVQTDQQLELPFIDDDDRKNVPSHIVLDK